MMDPPPTLLPSSKRPHSDDTQASEPPPAPSAPLDTPREMLFPLLLHIAPNKVTTTATEPDPQPPYTTIADIATTPTLSSEYDRAIARITALTSHLTPSMRASLTSLVSTLHTHLSPGQDIHPLISRIASPTTPDDTLHDWANTIDRGIIAFSARGGRELSPLPPPPRSKSPTPPKRAKLASSGRSQRVVRSCAERDSRTCTLSGKQDAGIVAHILPFSIRHEKAMDFWAFVALFRGEEETTLLKAMALGSGQETDTLRNVWWLSDDAHRYFGLGYLAIIPQLTEEQLPYYPHAVSEYSALVEFPFGSRKATIAVVSYDTDGDQHFVKMLKPGDSIRFTTPCPTRLPLPHPLLFQLHAVMSRIIALRAAAGYPVLRGGEELDSGDECLIDWEEEYEDTREENQSDAEDDWYVCNLPTDLGPNDCRLPHAGDTNTLNNSVYNWIQPVPSSELYSPPASPPTSRKRRRDDGDDSNSDDGNDKPRKVEVVKGEYMQRMGEMRQMMADKVALGRDKGARYP